MKTIKNTEFDPEADGSIAIVPVTVPGHIKELLTNDLPSGNTVFNFKVAVADEAEKCEVHRHTFDEESEVIPVNDDDGNPVMVSCKFMVGRNLNSTGVFLTPNPPSGEGWKNRKYVEIFEHMGVKFPETSDGKKKLGIVEEKDVIGVPVLAKLGYDKPYTNRNGKEVTPIRIMNVIPWEDGEKISAEEMKADDDIPF